MSTAPTTMRAPTTRDATTDASRARQTYAVVPAAAAVTAVAASAADSTDRPPPPPPSGRMVSGERGGQRGARSPPLRPVGQQRSGR